ncbi:MAG: endonuclease III [Actinomycetota bacterium]|nr:endonuclease III [Actinomycetota bacterium]
MAAARPSGASGTDARTVNEIRRRLRKAYGPLDPGRRLDPLEELVMTILSQNTSDVNSGRAYESLRTRFPSWERLAAARPREVEAAIRAGGLAKVKAPRILAVLREIRRREGGFDLSWMEDASGEDIEAYLTSLPGVGPKTVAVEMAFSLGRPALPVDTHVHRVATRLGFIPPGMPAHKAHLALAELVPPKMRIEMHVGLINHGRAICKAGRPRCEECPLNDLCPTAPLYLGDKG